MDSLSIFSYACKSHIRMSMNAKNLKPAAVVAQSRLRRNGLGLAGASVHLLAASYDGIGLAQSPARVSAAEPRSCLATWETGHGSANTMARGCHCPPLRESLLPIGPGAGRHRQTLDGKSIHSRGLLLWIFFLFLLGLTLVGRCRLLRLRLNCGCENQRGWTR